MDETRENIPPPEYPPTHCDGDGQHLDPNSHTRFTRASTPDQYSRSGGGACLLPDLTPVSKYMHSKRQPLTEVNSPVPEFVNIKDEILPFDSSSSIDESFVFNQSGQLAEPVGSCHDLGNSSASSVDTVGNTTQSSVKQDNQTIISSINESFDVRLPGPSPCNNETTDSDPAPLNTTLDAEADPVEGEPSGSNSIETVVIHPQGPSKCIVTVDAIPAGKMVAMDTTVDAEADPHELPGSEEAQPCSNTIEMVVHCPPGPSKCNVTVDADPTGKMLALNKTLDAEADPVEVEPCSTTIEIVVHPPPGPSKCNVTGDAGSETFALNTTVDAEADPAASEVESRSNAIESEPASAHISTTFLFESHTSVNQLDPQNTFNVECSRLQTTSSPVRVDPDPHDTFVMDSSPNRSKHQTTTTSPTRADLQNTFDMDGSTNLSNHQTSASMASVNCQDTFHVDSSAKPLSPENETFDVHPPGPSKCKDTTVDADAVSGDDLDAGALGVHEPIMAVGADQPVVAVSADESVVAVVKVEPETVVVGEDEPVAAVMEVETGPVVAGADEHEVAVMEVEPVLVADNAAEPAVAVCVEEPVFAAMQVEPGVVANDAGEPVVAVVAEQPVVPVMEVEPVLVADDADDPIVAAGADEPVVAVCVDGPGLVAVTEEESVVTAVSATSSAQASVTGPGNGKEEKHSQSSTLSMSSIADSPVVCRTTRVSNLDDTLELRGAKAQLTSTPMPRRHEPGKVGGDTNVVPRKLYQSHSQIVPQTNSVESHSQFVPPTNVVSNRKTFLNPEDPRVKHLLPPSASLIPGGNLKKTSALPMMRRAPGDGPGRTGIPSKQATGIPRSGTEVKGIPKAMVTRSAATVTPAVGALPPAAGLRKSRQGTGLPAAAQKAGPAGVGLPTATQKAGPAGVGLPTATQKAGPAGVGLPLATQKAVPAGAGLPLATQKAGPALRPPMTRRLAAKAAGEPTVHTNPGTAASLLKTGPSPTRRNLRSGGDSSVEAASLGKRKMDVPVPSSSAAGPSQTVKTGQSQTLKRPGSRLALPGPKQKKMDCTNCAELQKRLDEALQENKMLRDLLPSK